MLSKTNENTQKMTFMKQNQIRLNKNYGAKNNIDEDATNKLYF